MKLEEVEALKGTDTIISIDGHSSKTHSLPDDMTIEKFKSFLLTLTDNKRFDLKFCMDNKQTLKDLIAKSEKIEVTKNYSSKYDLVYYFNDKKHTYKDCNDDSKLKDFKAYLTKEFKDAKKFFKMYFKTEADQKEKIDATSYFDKYGDIMNISMAKFDKKDLTFG